MISAGIENLEAEFSGRYRKMLLPGVKYHWDDVYRDRKEQGPLPPALLSLIGQSTNVDCRVPAPLTKGSMEGIGGAVMVERKELTTGDTPDIQVLGNCFFFLQAGFAPNDHSSQEREIEKATDRLGE